MSRLPDESDHEYRARVLDPISPTFCAAKWYNATIWLGSGMTTSCHHPPAHKVSVDALRQTARALHNTPEKKADRRMMLAGEKPAGCDYCWKIESLGPQAISDRVYKSVIHDDSAVRATTQLGDADVDLRTLEIAFDRTCNFACSYCNPSFSTTWAQDITKNGPYEGLQTDGRTHFTHAHAGAQPYGLNEANPYVDAFFEWWDSGLSASLRELRLTGGEPLMSPHTWKLMDWFAANNSDMVFAINSNLGGKTELIDRLIAASHNIKHMHLYTSNESMGAHAEYIRDGLDWGQWTTNLQRMFDEGNFERIHIMATINALCLESLPEFLSWCFEKKSQNNSIYPAVSLNILRFPSFQSPLVLPLELRREYRARLLEWYHDHKDYKLLSSSEVNQLQRLADYLTEVNAPHSEMPFDIETGGRDFKAFYTQYDQRRKKDFSKTFPRLQEWYKGIVL